jgi:hypothetical protein
MGHPAICSDFFADAIGQRVPKSGGQNWHWTRGIDFALEARDRFQELMRILLTGNDTLERARIELKYRSFCVNSTSYGSAIQMVSRNRLKRK